MVLAVVRPESTPNCPEDDAAIDGTTFSVAVPRLLLLGVRFVTVLVREVVEGMELMGLKKEKDSMHGLNVL